MKFHSYDIEKDCYTATFTGEELHNILTMVKAAYDNYEYLDGTAMGLYEQNHALPIIEKVKNLIGDIQPNKTEHTIQLDLDLAGEVRPIFEGYSFESEDGCKEMGFKKSEARAYSDCFGNALMNMVGPAREQYKLFLKKNTMSSLDT